MLPADAADDLLTLLWEEEFVLISYTFIEVMGEGIEFLQDSPVRQGGGSGSGSGGGGGRGGYSAQDEVAEARQAPGGQPYEGGAPAGIVDMNDYDATPYFLEESEIRHIQTELVEEYSRDIRDSALDALLDTLEQERDPAIRREVLDLFESILPAQLATGGFRAVARVLRELRVIASRADELDAGLHGGILSFENRLSQADILEQLFRVLEDPTTRPPEEDIGEVLRELKPSALPLVLGHLGRTIDPAVRRALEPSVEALVRAQPNTLVDLLASGPPETIEPAIAMAVRLGLSQLASAVAAHLVSGPSATRLAAVRALGAFATPSSISAIEQVLDDPDRAVRQAALAALMERGGGGGLLSRLEAMLFDGKERGWERSERRTLFEAYGQLAGPAGIGRLGDLLEPRGFFRRKESPEVRACALFALGRIRTFEARLLADKFTADKEPVVRSAANSVLRDWAP
jgi:HEAT repeat protein